jgi:hypothetical protein
MHPGDYAALKAGSQHPLEPWAIPIMEAARLSGLSRSEIYKRMAAGQIEAVKSGSGRARQAGVDSLCSGDRLGRDRRVELSDSA